MFPVFVCLVLLFCPLIVIALDTWNTGYSVYSGTNKNVIVGSSAGPCYKITNSDSSKDYFIPTKTTAEWNAFTAHKPASLSIGNCCAVNMGSACGGVDVCLNSGTIQCDGTCSGTQSPNGTVCKTDPVLPSHTLKYCKTGVCIDCPPLTAYFTGNSCAQCPWGTIEVTRWDGNYKVCAPSPYPPLTNCFLPLTYGYTCWGIVPGLYTNLGWNNYIYCKGCDNETWKLDDDIGRFNW